MWSLFTQQVALERHEQICILMLKAYRMEQKQVCYLRSQYLVCVPWIGGAVCW